MTNGTSSLMIFSNRDQTLAVREVFMLKTNYCKTLGMTPYCSDIAKCIKNTSAELIKSKQKTKSCREL